MRTSAISLKMSEESVELLQKNSQLLSELESLAENFVRQSLEANREDMLRRLKQEMDRLGAYAQAQELTDDLIESEFGIPIRSFS